MDKNTTATYNATAAENAPASTLVVQASLITTFGMTELVWHLQPFPVLVLKHAE